ncbi:MAG TPA: heme peroxidase family protein [Kiritimatiellia bacterium]|nr:heme peroxidase family protein [Kiritimatiellia bacterium]HMP33639.1 heme peroxidase family protein [Kiritimatiellia bacterium]
MNSSKKKASSANRKAAPAKIPKLANDGPLAAQEFLDKQLTQSAAPKGFSRKVKLTAVDLQQRLLDLDVKPTVDQAKYLRSINKLNDLSAVSVGKLPEDIRASLAAFRSSRHGFHGAKVSLAWFPWKPVFSPCADKFGYMSTTPIRNKTKLPFNASTQALLMQLGNLIADPGREATPDSNIPAGFSYVGQFIDHDITLDVSSSLDVSTNATSINNMRTPVLDLESVYGRGPALDPYLYSFPKSGPPTAIKFQLGSNTSSGPGGPGVPGQNRVQTDFDVPRIRNALDPSTSTNTAIIGDPRNDENLIVSQFHHAMLKFHNKVVDLLLVAGFTGDVFVEAKRIVTHHYQWAIIHDFLPRICGQDAVDQALASVVAPIGSPFSMPVEFSVAAYRFGHSMIREQYWLSSVQIGATMGDVFAFARNPNLPVLSNWVVDFNAFFETGIPVAVFNRARRIDSVLTPALESLPDMVGMMAVLAARNLRRGLALGLPSGQGMAQQFGISPMSAAEITQNLPANEIALLQSGNGLLLQKTPLWYYILREAAVLKEGLQLGPVGARIIAETFVRMLKRDAGSYLNIQGGFIPFLPSSAQNQFSFADLIVFSGVTLP